MTILNKVSNKTLMPGITAIPDVPDAPTIGAVTDAGTGTSVTVAYTAAVTGGTVTTFTATSTPGSITGTGSSPITVSGLTSGTAYTFKVKGTNSTATGPESAASSAVTPISPTSYESIATVTVGSGGQSSISFTSIPSTFKHLQIRGIVLGTAAASGSLQARFNGDSGSNYTRHELGGNGFTAYAYATTGQTSANMYGYYDNISNSGFPCNFVMDILDYTNTNKYKTMKVLSGMDKNGTNYGEVVMKSSLWQSNSAISSLNVFIGGQNMGQYSSFALYGIKG